MAGSWAPGSALRARVLYSGQCGLWSRGGQDGNIEPSWVVVRTWAGDPRGDQELLTTVLEVDDHSWLIKATQYSPLPALEASRGLPW